MTKRPEIRHLDFPYLYALRLLLGRTINHRVIANRQFNRRSTERFQIKALRRLLRHARESTPYYQAVMALSGFDPDQLGSIEDLTRLPLLSRRQVQEHFFDLCSDEFPLAHCFIKKSSGSTGEPVRILLDYSSYIYADVLVLAFLKPFGIRPTQLLPTRTGVVFVTSFPTSTSFTYFPPHLNFSRFYKLSIHPDRWSSPEETLRFLSAKRPLIITGMPEHLVRLADLMREHDPGGRYPIRPRLVYTSGNKLRKKDKEVLQSHFAVRVVDIYAFTEFGPLACECVSGSGYHVDDGLILEVVRADGTVASAGEPGELVVTSLRNQAMPLIRYRTGDFGRVSPTRCVCGSHWPLLESIEGRTCEFFVRPDGSLVNPFVFIKHLDRMPLTQYRAIQESHDELRIEFIANSSDVGIEEEILRYVSGELDRVVKVRVEKVDRIGDPGRKVQNFVSRVPNPFSQP